MRNDKYLPKDFKSMWIILKCAKMKKRSLILFVVLSVLSLSAIQNKETLNGKWTLVCFKDFAGKTENCRPSNKSEEALTFTFKDNGEDGQFYGKTTTNSVSGEYQIDENRIHVKRFDGTKIAEHGWGRDFWRVIVQSNSYYFIDDTLVIRYESNTKGMFFVTAEK